MKLILVFMLGVYSISSIAEIKNCISEKKGSVNQYSTEALNTICKSLSKDKVAQNLMKDRKLKSKQNEILKMKRIVEQSRFGRESFVSTYIYLKKIKVLELEIQKHNKAKAYLEKFEHLEIYQYCLNGNLL